MCPSNDTFEKKMVLGLHSKDRKSIKDRANISNPKVNRGCPYSQPTAHQQTVWKSYWDPQYNIFHWGSTILRVSTLWIFSCDQAALWMVQSVCPSVRLSVCLSHLFHYVPIILSSWNFQELLPVTTVTSMQKVKVRGQRSRSQRSRPNLTVSGL